MWRKHKPNYAWVITNKTHYTDVEANEEDRFFTNPYKLFACSMIKNKTGKNLEDTVGYILNIVKFVEPTLGVFFSEFVADFIK